MPEQDEDPYVVAVQFYRTALLQLIDYYTAELRRLTPRDLSFIDKFAHMISVYDSIANVMKEGGP